MTAVVDYGSGSEAITVMMVKIVKLTLQYNSDSAGSVLSRNI